MYLLFCQDGAIFRDGVDFISIQRRNYRRMEEESRRALWVGCFCAAYWNRPIDKDPMCVRTLASDNSLAACVLVK